jgi:uncharacterized protein (DUF433 family)
LQAFEAKPPPLIAGSDGVVRVSATRVSLETIVSAFDAGATAEEIVQQYPSLELASVYAVLSYILDNRVEIDAYVTTRRDHARMHASTRARVGGRRIEEGRDRLRQEVGTTSP